MLKIGVIFFSCLCCFWHVCVWNNISLSKITLRPSYISNDFIIREKNLKTQWTNNPLMLFLASKESVKTTNFQIAYKPSKILSQYICSSLYLEYRQMPIFILWKILILNSLTWHFSSSNKIFTSSLDKTLEFFISQVLR